MENEEKEKPTFVTNDSSIHQGGKLDEADLEILKSASTGEGLIEIKNTEQFMALGKALSDTFNYYLEEAKKCMTKEQAEFVRMLRVDKGYSWRAVAHACYDQNWDNWEPWGPPSSQPMGMALCQIAAEFFNENYRKEPWN